MIIVAGTLTVDPERREEMLAGRREQMLASQAEPGCLDYVMTPDPFDPGLVRLFERWESKQALGAHIAGLAAAPPAPADAPSPVLVVEILQYDIASFGPLGS